MEIRNKYFLENVFFLLSSHFTAYKNKSRVIFQCRVKGADDERRNANTLRAFMLLSAMIFIDNRQYFYSTILLFFYLLKDVVKYRGRLGCFTRSL